MPFFRYVARDKTGRLIDEVVETVSEESLINSLQAKGLLVISLGPALQTKTVKKIERRYHRKAKIEDLILFSRELSTLLSSGVTLTKSLEILSKQIESLALLRAVEQIKRDVEGGYTFQNALKKHDTIFSAFWINLVETGEASGHLPSTLDQLACYLEESAELKRKIISALIYPCILVIVAIGAITVFLLKIVPVFSDIFRSFGVELPLLTRIVIGMSNIIKRYFLILLGILIASVFLFKKYISTERGRVQFDRIKFKLPLLGPLLREVATERFASALSTLIKSGVPILHALDISEKTSENKVMEMALKDIKIAVRDGKGMSQPMEDSGVFSPLVVQMVRVGEEIGELGQMLERVAIFYKERVNTFVGRLTTMFEPIILVFMGIVVGVLVIAMFMPIFSISTAIKASG